MDVCSFLDLQLQHGRLEHHSYLMLRYAVSMMRHMSKLLFPPTHVFHAHDKAKIQKLTYDTLHILDAFSEHVGRKHAYTSKTMRTLPNLIDVDENAFYERLLDWRDRLQ